MYESKWKTAGYYILSGILLTLHNIPHKHIEGCVGKKIIKSKLTFSLFLTSYENFRQMFGL